MDFLQERVAATFEQESGRVLAALVARLRDVELAEDSLQDALVTALERWPRDGIPHNPGAWITTTARNCAIDRLRRDRTLERKKAVLTTLAELEQDDRETTSPDDIPDERLKLIFTCCHPALAKDAQVALTLQTVGGLTTPEIASAFLIPLPTMAQRLVRAKRKIRDAGIPYEIPSTETIAERLDAVLSVLYLIFNAGYIAPSGDELIRHDLCAEAIRLARILAGLLRDDPALSEDAESLGLLALMLLHHSRRDARVTAEGEMILLEEQDRSLWHAAEIEKGLAILDHAMSLRQPGIYQIQAAIAALHAQAKRPEDTDWKQIVALYDALYDRLPTSIIALNRAVAVAMAEGPQAGLTLLDALEAQDSESLQDYYLYHAARADLLRRLGSLDVALAAYRRALETCENRTEQSFLSQRLAEVECQIEANNPKIGSG